jgi:dCTP deaminase
MILSQPQIREAVDRKEIRFEPGLEDKQWHEASVDLRLGYKFAHGFGAIADAGLWREKILKERDELGKKETFSLESDEFVMAQTYEHIWIPRRLIAMVEGRSSYARAGLSMHQTAPWIQPGWHGHITLEIRNSGPLTIELTPMEDMPCQLTFFELTSELSEALAYGSRSTDVFQGQLGAIPKSGK